jgi:hypothetical protein
MSHAAKFAYESFRALPIALWPYPIGRPPSAVQRPASVVTPPPLSIRLKAWVAVGLQTIPLCNG